jgi:hypothetical protein
VDESAEVRLNQKEKRSVKIQRIVREGCCLPPILFNLLRDYHTEEALEGLGVFKMRGQVIRNIKYVEDFCVTG